MTDVCNHIYWSQVPPRELLIKQCSVPGCTELYISYQIITGYVIWLAERGTWNETKMIIYVSNCHVPCVECSVWGIHLTITACTDGTVAQYYTRIHGPIAFQKLKSCDQCGIYHWCHPCIRQWLEICSADRNFPQQMLCLRKSCNI